MLLGAPGVVLALNVRREFWGVVGWAVLSIATISLAAALLSVVIPGQLPPWSTAPLAVLALVGALAIRRRPVLPRIEIASLLPPAAMVAVSLVTYAQGFSPEADGSLHVHSWYNADWFKHLGHAHAAVNYGFPMKDGFGGAAPLHYYWLFYTLVALPGWVSGDPGSALLGVNLVMVACLWLLIYGLLRRVGAAPWPAALLTVASWAAFNIRWVALWLGTGESLADLAEFVRVPSAMLAPLNLFIPHHCFALLVLLAWALIWLFPAERPSVAAKWITHGAVASLGAISTLFGALLLVIFGLATLANRRDPLAERLALCVGVGIASVAITLVLGVVDPSFGSNAVASPIFTSAEVTLPIWQRLMWTVSLVGLVGGPVALLGLVALHHWWRYGTATDPVMCFAAIAMVIGLLGIVLPEALLENIRIGREIRLRAIYTFAIGALLLITWAMCHPGRRLIGRRAFAAAFAAFTLIALPGNVLNILWHGLDGPEHFTRIPPDDMAVLAALRSASTPNALIWQKAESPEIGQEGDDTWAPIIAGRTVLTSYRATDYVEAAPLIERNLAYFMKREGNVPEAADWVYLSRVLHPGTFDVLRNRLDDDAAWQRGTCRPNACLFVRVGLRGTEVR